VLLAEAGARIDERARDGRATALMTAAGHSHSLTVKALLEHGADPNARDAYGYTALHRAAQVGSPEMLSALLAHGARVDTRGKGGATPLHVAAHAGRADIVQLLLEGGADPNVAEASESYTPLHYAAAAGDTKMVRLLLEHGANVNAQAYGCRTPFAMAAAANALETARVLADAGGKSVKMPPEPPRPRSREAWGGFGF
jgi:ankyrin repeat protein